MRQALDQPAQALTPRFARVARARLAQRVRDGCPGAHYLRRVNSPVLGMLPYEA